MKRFLLSLMAIATLCAPASAQNSVKNLYASNETLNTEKLCNTEQPVQLYRYLFSGYNTLCLPMSVSNEQLQKVANGARLEEMVAIGQEGSTLNLYFIDCTNEGVKAGVPYLIFSPKSQYLRFKNTEATDINDRLTTVRMSDSNGNTVSFGSSWEAVRESGRYGIPAKQDKAILESILVRTDMDKAFLPTRCGFNWETQAANATDINICHIKSLNDVTGIKGIESVKAENSLYDLNGRKVSTEKRGIMIQNGKKIIKK